MTKSEQYRQKHQVTQKADKKEHPQGSTFELKGEEMTFIPAPKNVKEADDQLKNYFGMLCFEVMQEMFEKEYEPITKKNGSTGFYVGRDLIRH